VKKKDHDKEILMARGAWVNKIVSLLPLVERERRRKRLREKRLIRFMCQ
jgi:hypothetical protein